MEAAAGDLAWAAFQAGSLDLLDLEDVFYILANLDRRDEALQVAAQILARPVVPAQILQPLGVQLINMGDYPRAETALQRIIRARDEDSARYLDQASHDLLWIGVKNWPYERLAPLIKPVLQGWAEVLEYHLELIERMLEAGEAGAALAEFERLASLRSGSAPLENVLLYARALDACDRQKEALEVLDRAVARFGLDPEILRLLLTLCLDYRCDHLVDYLRGYQPPTSEIRGLAVVALSRMGYYDRAMDFYQDSILDLADQSLRNLALQMHLRNLAYTGHWDKVSGLVGFLPVEILEDQLGQFYWMVSRLVSLLSAREPDLPASAIIFEHLLAFPLDLNQLNVLLRWLMELFEKRPIAARQPRFLDISDCLLLQIADLGERTLGVARQENLLTKLEQVELEKILNEIQLKTAAGFINKIAHLARKVNYG
jgi:tetratricopeptide (TPR) repeat protein